MDRLQQLLAELEDEEEDSLHVIRNERRIYQRGQPFHYFSDQEFKNRFRMEKESAMFISQALTADLEYPSNKNHPVSVLNQVLLTLRYYATGTFYTTMADFIGVCPATAFNVINRVTRVILLYRRQYIKMPANETELRSTQLRHFDVAGFPRVLGLIDCTHVKINSPGGEGAEIYRNRKGYFSLNVQAIVNAELKFCDVVARWCGSSHDMTIFNASRVRAKIEMGKYGKTVLIGDAGYRLSPHLMTPLTNPQTQEEHRYQESLILTRNIVERTFGVWKRRFPIVGLGTQIRIIRVRRIIVATMILFNILRDLNDEEPDFNPNDYANWSDDDDDDEPIPPPPHNSQAARIAAQAAQRVFINYFQ